MTRCQHVFMISLCCVVAAAIVSIMFWLSRSDASSKNGAGSGYRSRIVRAQGQLVAKGRQGDADASAILRHMVEIQLRADTTDWDIVNAVSILEAIDDIASIRHLLGHTDPRVRCMAVKVLADRHDQSSVAQLVHLTHDGEIARLHYETPVTVGGKEPVGAESKVIPVANAAREALTVITGISPPSPDDTEFWTEWFAQGGVAVR